MTRLLTRLFIKHPNDTKNPIVRRAYGKMVAIVCIILNILLFFFKFLVGTLSGSVSIRADAVNNLSDAGSSVIALVCFKISAKPADRDHPFGHARIEYIASMIISFLILLVGVELVRDSIEKLISPVAISLDLITIIVLSVSILCKVWMSLFNRRISKKIGSEVMRATAADSLSDAVATAAVLVANLLSLVLPAAIRNYADPVMGLLVAALILLSGCRVLRDTKNSILGEAPDPAVLETIRATVAEYPEVLGIHDMMLHSYGTGYTFASFHAEVDGSKDIFLTHDAVDLIEKRLYQEHRITCTIHLDPVVLGDPARDAWLARVHALAKELDGRICVHDFRMVPGVTHTNLIFDIAVPFEQKMSNAQIKDSLAAAIQKEDPAYFSVITVDRV